MTKARLRAGTLAMAAAAILTAGGMAAAQTGSYRAPRTPDGHPDLQGYWNNYATVPLERPANTPLTFATRAEEDAYAKARAEAFRAGAAAGLGQGDAEWAPTHPPARIGGRLRTSILVAPPDGRIPYGPGKRERLAEINRRADFGADGPEDRTPVDRCLVPSASSAGPPMLNHHSASGYQIVQTPGAVVIVAEKNTELRIVRLGEPPRPPGGPAASRRWTGVSTGRWEGETLVVTTTGFRPEEAYRNLYLIGEDAVVTERFTRVSPTELLYRFEVHDPATYTADWAGELPMHAETGPLAEYACHEGNYAMAGMLAGARREEAEGR